MKKRILSLILILCMLVGVVSFASCGKKKPAATEDPGKETAATTDKWEALSPEIKAFSVDDRCFRIECAEYNEVQKISSNMKYLAGFATEDGKADTSTIGQMIYQRNQKAQELFGTSIEYVYWAFDKAAWGKAAGNILDLVQGSDPDTPDMFVNQIYDLNKAMLSKGCFMDLWTIPGAYFDFEAEGWLGNWMKDMSFTGDRAYILAGDYFVDVLRSMGVMPFNSKLMDDAGSRLAPALFNGQGLAAGETMSQRFFDFVERGEWTWEALGKLCEAVWVDKGTAGQNDVQDTLGIIADCYGGVCTALYIYSAGEELFVRKNAPDGRAWVYYPDDASALGDIFDAVASVFKGNGALTTTGVVEDSSETTPGIAYHRLKFARDELLFMGYSLLGDLEDDVFQQMISHSLYSVVPLPKVSVDKKYNTFITDTADAGAINVKTTPGKAKVISVYLQYCTENSADIREQFLEIVTKYKTTDYNQGTDRMLDLIYDSVLYGGDKVIDGAVWDYTNRAQKRWYDYMKNGKCVVESSEFVTSYNSEVSAKQSVLDEILNKWYELPRVE